MCTDSQSSVETWNSILQWWLYLGHTNLVEHTTDTGNAKPIKQPSRQVPITFAGRKCKALEKLHAQGVIHPSTSPWSSPVVLVQKISSQVHPCVDYWQLNKVTRDVAYPIPRTHDCLDKISGATMVSTMDITLAYNQVPITEQEYQRQLLWLNMAFMSSQWCLLDCQQLFKLMSASCCSPCQVFNGLCAWFT